MSNTITLQDFHSIKLIFHISFIIFSPDREFRTNMHEMQIGHFNVVNVILPTIRIVISICTINLLFTLQCIPQTDILNFESAKTIGVNQVRADLNFGVYLFSYNESTERIFNQANFSVGFGIHEQFELKLGYSFIHHDQMDNLYLIQLTPKYC